MTENSAEGEPGPEYGAIEVGPEYGDTGDPAWIRPRLREGGAVSGRDGYLPASGRWRERLYSDESHPADVNPFIVGRVGLRLAVDTLWRVLHSSEGQAEPATHLEADRDPVVLAMVATYEAMEWVHSLDEHLRAEGRYERASDLDPVYGGYVDGVIGARNASHHGLRRVIGVMGVTRPTYAARGPLWVHTGTLNDIEYPSVRWLRTLPSRTEAKYVDDTTPIYSLRQLQEFEKHLSGREVGLTLRAAMGFFYYSLDGEGIPADWTAPSSWHPPPIDPAYLPSEEVK